MKWTGLLTIAMVWDLVSKSLLRHFSRAPLEPTIEYGFEVDTFLVVKDEIKTGQSLGKILSQNGVSFSTIDRIAKETRKTDYDVRYLKAGHPYALFCEQDSTKSKQAYVFIYELDKINYVVYDFRDTLKVYEGEKPWFSSRDEPEFNLFHVAPNP